MSIINLMKEKELRKKAYFTLFVLAVANLLTQIPVYGVNSSYLDSMFQSTGILTFIDSLSGGSLSHLSIAGFGITSYITASIILQLMAVVFPKIESVRRDGERGKQITEKVTFILAIVFTLISGIVLAVGFGKNGLLIEYKPIYVITAVVSWLFGSVIIILLGQKVEENGVGNGITLILGCNILSRIPNNIINYYHSSVVGKSVMMMSIYIAGLAIGLFIFYYIAVYLQTGVLRIPIKQTRKQASILNTDGYIPINVNIANVLPVIYASTLIGLPTILTTLFGVNFGKTGNKIISLFSSANWYKPESWYQPLGLVIYVILIAVFSLFASELAFSSSEIADSMKKNGNVIPGINPGKETIEFLEKRRKVLSIINFLFLTVIAIVPDAVCSLLGISSFTFLGTSLIIVVSMLFDTSLRIYAVSIHNDKQFKLFGESERGK